MADDPLVRAEEEQRRDGLREQAALAAVGSSDFHGASVRLPHGTHAALIPRDDTVAAWRPHEERDRRGMLVGVAGHHAAAGTGRPLHIGPVRRGRSCPGQCPGAHASVGPADRQQSPLRLPRKHRGAPSLANLGHR
eukprot:scaffold1830_cov246-Pinguiococcus_pyrenoidosus.AAC.2